MRSYQQNNSIFNTLLNILGTDIVIQRQVCDHLDSKDHLLVVHGLPDLQIDQTWKIIELEIIDCLCFGCEEKPINAIKQ